VNLKFFLIAPLALLVSSCAVLGPSKEQRATADYGNKPSFLVMNTQVKSSQSGKVEVGCAEAKKGWLRDPENKGEYIFGWISKCSIWSIGTSAPSVGQFGVYSPGGYPKLNSEDRLYIFKDGQWLWTWESGSKMFSFGYSGE
jgi:hypothetical protein